MRSEGKRDIIIERAFKDLPREVEPAHPPSSMCRLRVACAASSARASIPALSMKRILKRFVQLRNPRTNIETIGSRRFRFHLIAQYFQHDLAAAVGLGSDRILGNP